MKFSNWSDRIKREVGLINLMKDLGTAAASEGHPLYMLGGGNPAHIPEMEKYFRTQMENVMRSPTYLSAWLEIMPDHKDRTVLQVHLPNCSRQLTDGISDPKTSPLQTEVKRLSQYCFDCFPVNFLTAVKNRCYCP